MSIGGSQVLYTRACDLELTLVVSLIPGLLNPFSGSVIVLTGQSNTCVRPALN